MVPGHAHDEPAAGELCHLHQQQRVGEAAALGRVVDGELLHQRRRRPRVRRSGEEFGVLQGTIRGGGGDECHAIAAALDVDLVAAGLCNDHATGDRVVGDQRSGQRSLYGLGGPRGSDARTRGTP